MIIFLHFNNPTNPTTSDESTAKTANVMITISAMMYQPEVDLYFFLKYEIKLTQHRNVLTLGDCIGKDAHNHLKFIKLYRLDKNF